MKKKIIALSLVLAMLAITAIGSTLAYFTDKESAKNVFTVGNVQIDQIEQERSEESGSEILVDFTQNQEIVPGADVVKDSTVTVGDYTLDIRSGETYIDKIVTVANTGASDAYIRTIIAIPTVPGVEEAEQSNNWFHWNMVTDSDTDPANGWYYGTEVTGEYPVADADWAGVRDVLIGGKYYDIYVATNVNVIAEGETTAPCLLGFYLDKRVDCEVLEDGSLNYTMGDIDLGDISSLDILVASEAVQAEGFDSAWEALEAAFGEVDAGYDFATLFDI